jgi:hypothetical protein
VSEAPSPCIFPNRQIQAHPAKNSVLFGGSLPKDLL